MEQTGLFYFFGGGVSVWFLLNRVRLGFAKLEQWGGILGWKWWRPDFSVHLDDAGVWSNEPKHKVGQINFLIKCSGLISMKRELA